MKFEKKAHKVERDSSGRADSKQMIGHLREQLHWLAGVARELSETLGESGKRPTAPERNVIEAAIDSQIKSLMTEAMFMAMSDDPQGFRNDMEYVLDWMEMKANF